MDKIVTIDELFNQLEEDRASGRLPAKVLRGGFYFEPSQSNYEYLDKVSLYGREPGSFIDGVWVPLVIKCR